MQTPVGILVIQVESLFSSKFGPPEEEARLTTVGLLVLQRHQQQIAGRGEKLAFVKEGDTEDVWEVGCCGIFFFAGGVDSSQL